MPVIGRLDEQVNDVLITPLEKRRGPAPPRGQDEPEPSLPPSSEPPDEAPAGETSRAPDALPVWLL
jgi:hypothetical protein